MSERIPRNSNPEQLDEVQNVVIFVGDAVRYDEISRSLADLGPTYKTIAASLHTPASFASMLTGLNVPSHGVKGFQNKLSDDIDSIADMPNYNVYLSDKTGTMHEDIHRIFGISNKASIMEAEEPFIWIARDPGGHAPYNGYDGETYDQVSESAPEYLDRVSGDRKKIREDYQMGVKSSLERFKQVIEQIKKQGIEQETLAIYTSDHGELLGEYGLLGHNHVAVPELVYVPTTFVHPSLDNGLMTETIRHIDLLPILHDNVQEFTPINSLENTASSVADHTIGYNHFEMSFYNKSLFDGLKHIVESCWDSKGGHVYVNSSYINSISLFSGIAISSHKGKQMLKDRRVLEALRLFVPGHSVHGVPDFDQATARSYIEEVKKNSMSSINQNLDEDTKNRLNKLGYL